MRSLVANFLLSLSLVMAGCSESAKTEPTEGELILYDDELFPEENSRHLLDHTTIIAGDAVRLSEPAKVIVTYEIWQNGEIVQSYSSFSSSSTDKIIAFSVRPSINQAERLTLTVSTNNGSASHDLPKPASEYNSTTYGTIFMSETPLLPDQKQAVWSMVSTDEAETSLSEKGVKAAKWGLIIYVERDESK
ncbi:hypothetical protein NLX67_15005 [Domibacillus sp. A3M-37]|uniref:hypothetical protein n=1 Tax=Domibacillus sp. A3M-37 TaxID=2962037 RepID=UPI0020B69D6F|nr:hypothetical protein [Domibacillus sp. A3M-37]MCP3763683.1 hypothetical protein [Domibacillus sp. A3M-37]